MAWLRNDSCNRRQIQTRAGRRNSDSLIDCLVAAIARGHDRDSLVDCLVAAVARGCAGECLDDRSVFDRAWSLYKHCANRSGSGSGSPVQRKNCGGKSFSRGADIIVDGDSIENGRNVVVLRLWSSFRHLAISGP